MPASPRCSIVMPAFNVEAYISEAIQSVLAQSVAEWELLVVDDGSGDGTVRAVQVFQDPLPPPATARACRRWSGTQSRHRRE